MTGYILDASGNEYRLPTLLSWSVEHTDGRAADSFSVSFLFSPGMEPTLHQACRFRADHGGTVFYGVIDEYTVEISGAGMTAELFGRGMGALLLDNQCEATAYVSCSLEDLLRRFVTPLGIKAARCDAMPRLSGFAIAPGSSVYGALTHFCGRAAGIRPRFDRAGGLLLTKQTGQTYRLSAEKASCLRLTDKRYGVISSVTVKTVDGARSTVKNSELLGRGGSCARVVNVPRTTGYETMTYTGKYQIDKSREGSFVIEVTLAELFAAFAGDVVQADLQRLGVSGTFCVIRSRSWANGQTAGTRLWLERAEV